MPVSLKKPPEKAMPAMPKPRKTEKPDRVLPEVVVYSDEDKNKDKAYDMDVNLKKGGKVSSASKRADGCCVRGKTRA